MKNSVKVFFATALGAGLGTIVSLSVNHYLWWIGLIVGGAIGYLSYEWRTVVNAIPQAYRAARGWRFSPLFGKKIGWSFLASACVVTDSMLAFGVFCAITTKISVQVIFDRQVIILLCYSWLALWLVVDGALLSAAPKHFTTEVFLEHTKCIAFIAAPPILIFWHIPRGIIWLVFRVPAAVKFMITFVWKLFLLIHSERRLICGMDAMIGAAIGYFAGSAIVGALTGGILGVINYKLVSEGWLIPGGYLKVKSQ